MYKKIYRYMKFLSLFTLILCTLLVSSVSFSTFDKNIKNEIKTEAQIIKKLLDSGVGIENIFDEADVEAEVKKAEKEKRLTVVSKDKKIIYDI